MSIPFIIRDDDLCFFTQATDIENLYAPVWKEFPITFAVVPWQKGTKAGHIPVKYWHTSEVFPVDKNRSLVELVKRALDHGYADIALHGINHTYEIAKHQFIPELMNYTADFGTRLEKAKIYLEDVFGIDIRIFVPPSNTMHADIAKVLIGNNWSLLNYPGLRQNTRPLSSFKHQFARIKRLLNFVLSGTDITEPLVWPNRWEVGGFALTPGVDIKILKKMFLLAMERNHPFVLTTHYWEHQALLPNNCDKTQYDLLCEFLDFVSGYDIEPMGASRLKFDN